MRKWIPWVGGFSGGVVVASAVVAAFLAGRVSSREPQTEVTLARSAFPTPSFTGLDAPIPTLPDVPRTGCVAHPSNKHLSYLRGLLVVAVEPGTSVAATFHMPNGDFTENAISGSVPDTEGDGQRPGYAFFPFRLDQWTPLEQLPEPFEVVTDVTVRQSHGEYHCATSFVYGAE